ncbi:MULTISPECIES: hypothetical protein [unclassified Massilia]|uniref:hypothetical protein n=1 Tax=unclassified Massilia TaxID=2609279 RepID=UPI001CBFC560|nr:MULTISPECIES: hypothetical protein [unclassified Massilia]UMR29940.1 hypothetical protein MJ904_23390 [Massilia sp. MB5]
MMDVSTLHPHHLAEVSELFQQRTDLQSSAIVDKGIAVQDCFNTMCAIEYLKSHNINPQVIERVLLQPELRRRLVH